MLGEGPSWIGIGAQRCGTTWFTDLLVQHPEFDVPQGRKEHHWLYLYGLVREWDETARDGFRDLFDGDGKKLGEWTPYYLRASWVCELAAEVLPDDAPILVMFRDPIDRFASALRHEMTVAARMRRKSQKASQKSPLRGRGRDWRDTQAGAAVRRALRRSDLGRAGVDKIRSRKREATKGLPDSYWDRPTIRYVGSDLSWGGMYAAQMDAWTATFPEDRFIVLQYEKVRRDPQLYADLVWERLGLKPVRIKDVDRPSIASTKGKLWRADDYPHVVRALKRIYRPDAERLADRFDIDLKLWTRTMS